MSGMTTSRKILYVLSIISLVFAVIAVIFGIMAVAVSGASEMASDASMQSISDAMGMSVADLVVVAGIVFIIDGVLEIFVSILGIRGAKNPNKMGLLTVLCGIAAVLSVIGTISGMVNGNMHPMYLETIITVVIFILCLNIRKEAKEANAENAA